MKHKIDNHKDHKELVQDALNFARSELQTELQPKLDKHYINYAKVDFITKIISILANN